MVRHPRRARRPGRGPRPLDDDQWATQSLCGRWTVEEVVAVASRTAVAGLRLDATDGPFATGEGPLVRGTSVALTMAMAGRETYCDDLDGPGVSILRDRCRPQVT